MKLTDPLTKWQQYLLMAVGVVVIIAGLALPPRPTTLGGWIKAVLPIAAGGIWGGYLAPRRRAAAKGAEIVH